MRNPIVAEKSTEYISAQATILRWREAYQHDFAAHMDWCIADTFEKANHNPVAVVYADAGKGKAVAKIRVEPGIRVSLNAEETYDPNGDQLTYRWFVYKEAGTYKGSVDIENNASARAYLIPPEVKDPESLHLILEVKDNGQPSLYSYRRVIITVEDK